jgi:hypothetical protein
MLKTVNDFIIKYIFTEVKNIFTVRVYENFKLITKILS